MSGFSENEGTRQKYKLNVGKIDEGFVIDHIRPGRGLMLYHDMGLDKLDCSVAIIQNASSRKMGKKDIIKVETSIDNLNMDIISLLDHNATVDVIKNGEIISKPELPLPKEVKNIIRCKNPRCIASIEQGIDNIFVLTDVKTATYRCKYCETEYENK
ncbi:MAG: aspartate carbamoyltransferase regulatory subunit [Lachnospiraceae bacterium]|nr:aspartate carbamoyltransferase regulatory subunit [Lachnospiraceae bacterium]MBR1913542.1 aspartate carbamoyltransferase regulatory subunit [Lachnospiraceae bacterium]